jgi:putative ABC transport system permease protein
VTPGASVAVALAALRRNTMRSFLTLLGIVIGVAAVVTMQSMGEGATAYVGEAISGLGSNMLIVTPGSPRSFGAMTLNVPLFTVGDQDALRRGARAVARIAATNTRSLRVVAGGVNRITNAAGVTPEYFDIRDWGAASGRVITPEDERRAALACVIGQTVRDALFPGLDPIGREMRVQNVACRIVGVMEAKGASHFGVDQDDVVLMPRATFSRRIVGNDRIAVFMVAARSADQLDEAKDQITSILKRRRHIAPGELDDFAVHDPREIQAVLQSVTGVLTALLAGVAAVSLLVGGIGIMNIMLVSVTERTREIGIRLAVGARARDILTQFLVEAVVLSGLGGVIGLAAGIAAALGAARAIHIPFVVPPLASPIAFAVSVLVGVVFGVVPARKASRLHPLAALRFE